MKTQYGVNAKSLNNLLEDVLADANFFRHKSIINTSKQPPVNITETKAGYAIAVLVAGIAKEQIQIETKQKTLVISYQPEEVTSSEEQTVLRKEFTIEGFERKFALDEKMDIENISAKYENGVLNIMIPKLVIKESAEKVIKID